MVDFGAILEDSQAREAILSILLDAGNGLFHYIVKIVKNLIWQSNSFLSRVKETISFAGLLELSISI